MNILGIKFLKNYIKYDTCLIKTFPALQSFTSVKIFSYLHHHSLQYKVNIIMNKLIITNKNGSIKGKNETIY